MKNCIKIFIILIISIYSSLAQKRTVIYGNIKNNTTATGVRISYIKNQFNNEWIDFKAPIDKKGNFKIVFELKEFKPMIFNIGDKYNEIFLEPGDSLNFSADFKKYPQSFKYSGKGSINNNFNNDNYTSFTHILYDNSILMKLHQKAAGVTIEKFMQETDSLCSYYLGYLNKSKNKVTPSFYAHLNATIYYNFVQQKLLYPITQYSKLIKNGKLSYTQLISYYTFLDTVSVNNDSLLNNEKYISFLEYLFYFKSNLTNKSLLKNDSVKYNPLAYYYFNDMIFSGKTSEYFKADVAIRHIAQGTKKDMLQLYELTKKELTDTSLLRILEQSYQKNKNRKEEIKEGNMFPEFDLMDINGKKINLKDFVGKVVYIDFWGSWCSPCMQEMPNSKELKEKLKDIKDKIVFLYFNCFDTNEGMNNAIKDKQIEGIHIKLSTDQVANEYAINGFPTYFLLDKKGKVVKIHMRPSDEKIELIIRNLAKE
ncbi:MAG: TlpA disulfide reductase family protein [Bacteroidota bacterium]|nr:TlpA disulfide reductase family protein [Bacteroidota bacterium]